MASPTVMPNSLSKEEHREAGRRRLEEFRKKRAANQSKKAPPSASSVATETRLERTIGGSSTPGLVLLTDDKATRLVKSSDLVFVDHVPATTAAFVNKLGASYADPSQLTETNQGSRSHQNYDQTSGVSRRTSQSSISGKDDEQFKENDSSFSRADSVISFASSSHENYDGISIEDKLVHTSMIGKERAHTSREFSGQSRLQDFGREEARNMPSDARNNGPLYSDDPSGSFSSSFGRAHDFSNDSEETSEHLYSDPLKIFPIHEPRAPLFYRNNSRNSRPSFLDSLNLPLPSSAKQMFPKRDVSNPSISNNIVPNQNTLVSSDLQNAFPETIQSSSGLVIPNFPDLKHSTSSSVPMVTANLVQDSYRYAGDRGYDPGSSKQNDDFATLEQHIEDLTQEKFSLQRALELSRTLADSLAAENSTLTDTYNQQGIVVSELKYEIEKLHEEINDKLKELESVKAGYSDVRLECNAADERAKLLASELIELEEKALRLRSNELKLQRHLEDTHTEIVSCKKKISNLQKERQDFQATIDALQEEKKILQSKLSKAPGPGKIVDTNRSKKNASVSTEDLGPAVGSSVQDFLSSKALPVDEVMSVGMDVPSDQKRIIENINILITELAVEKEELTRALAAQSSQNSKLKEQMKELTRKLEVQTQRLELLTSQSMAAEAGRVRQPEPHTLRDNARYADEGDEVVERVLGWIMKLFPGGPSRRHSSKAH